MALAREILAITGITIWETGEPGKGARFEMTVLKREVAYGWEECMRATKTISSLKASIANS